MIGPRFKFRKQSHYLRAKFALIFFLQILTKKPHKSLNVGRPYKNISQIISNVT